MDLMGAFLVPSAVALGTDYLDTCAFSRKTREVVPPGGRSSLQARPCFHTFIVLYSL